MADLMFLSRVLLARTEHDTVFYFDRRLGLLVATGHAGALRAIEPDQLRRGYPRVWAVWVRFVALLPEGVVIVRGPATPSARVGGRHDHPSRLRCREYRTRFFR
jgi:hypothetical protein